MPRSTPLASMKRPLWLILLLICTLAESVLAQMRPQQFSAAKSPEEVGFSAERLKRLDNLLQGFVDQGIAPNALSFVARKGKIVHYKAFGYRHLASKTPLKPDDIFRIASQSKAVTTTALMMLWEEGKFMLSDPLSKYIPAFKQPKVLVNHDTQTLMYTTRPAKSEITIGQLLTHTAGIPYEHPLEKRPEMAVPYFNSVENESLASVVERIAARPLLHDPGERFTYGLNTDVAGRLVEILSGMSLDEYFSRYIFEPLGMKDTYFYLPAEKAGRLVELYSKGSAAVSLSVHENNTYRNYATSGARTYFSGGAGLVSTAEDYAKLCQMLLNQGMFNGRRLLGRKTVEMMTRNQIGDLDVWDRGDKFGLGFQIFTPKSNYGGAGSIGAYMWGGMYCSEFTIDPHEDLILLVFTNVHPYAHYGDFVKKFRDLVYQALD